jgi:hypothetical protein
MTILIPFNEQHRASASQYMKEQLRWQLRVWFQLIPFPVSAIKAFYPDLAVGIEIRDFVEYSRLRFASSANKVDSTRSKSVNMCETGAFCHRPPNLFCLYWVSFQVGSEGP